MMFNGAINLEGYQDTSRSCEGWNGMKYSVGVFLITLMICLGGMWYDGTIVLGGAVIGMVTGPVIAYLVFLYYIVANILKSDIRVPENLLDRLKSVSYVFNLATTYHICITLFIMLII